VWLSDYYFSHAVIKKIILTPFPPIIIENCYNNYIIGEQYK
jgi:hypothetical protein